MKKILLSAAVLLLTSCAGFYQQVAHITSDDQVYDDMTFTESGITVSYDFWSEGGSVQMKVTNNTDDDSYIDLTRSFLVLNGMVNDYYKQRSFTYPVGLETGVTETIQQRDVLITPPHSSRMLTVDGLKISTAPYRQCGLARNPRKKENAMVEFSRQTSPYIIRNILCVEVNGSVKNIVHDLYVDQISNVRLVDARQVEYVQNCNEKAQPVKQVWNLYQSPARYYHIYRYDSFQNDRIQ